MKEIENKKIKKTKGERKNKKSTFSSQNPRKNKEDKIKGRKKEYERIRQVTYKKQRK